MSNSALEVFEQFVQTFPTDPKVEEAREYIVRIHARLAEKAMLSVRWYFRRHRYRAAQIYCDKIIREYPDNAYWAEAVYYKGLISLRRGQREDAARFFSQVVAYPGEAPAKELAGDRLKEIRN